MDKSKLKASDLQVAAVTATGSATRAFSMTHKMGLAQISMNTWNNVKNFIFYIASPAAAKDENYTWDNLAYTNVTSSSSYSSSSPKPLIDTYHWYIMKGSTTFTTDATVTGAATYTGQGVSGAISADIRNNNGWTKALASVSGEVTKYTADISAKTYLSRIPYTVAYGDALYSDGALSKTTASGCFWTSRTAIAYVSSIGNKGADPYKHGYAMSLHKIGGNGAPTTYLWQNSHTDTSLPNFTGLNGYTDYKGYNNTKTLCESVSNPATVYPAANAAWTYAARNKANNGTINLTGNLANSHWFLPSAGQLYDLIRQVAGLPDYTNKASNSSSWQASALGYNPSTRFLENINAVLKKFIDNGGYSVAYIPYKYGYPDYSHLGGAAYIQGSTEYNNTMAFRIEVWETSSLWLSDFGGSAEDTKMGNGHSVIPCIGF